MTGNCQENKRSEFNIRDPKLGEEIVVLEQYSMRTSLNHSEEKQLVFPWHISEVHSLEEYLSEPSGLLLMRYRECNRANI